jgi:hypothetical protein
MSKREKQRGPKNPVLTLLRLSENKRDLVEPFDVQNAKTRKTRISEFEALHSAITSYSLSLLKATKQLYDFSVSLLSVLDTCVHMPFLCVGH